MNQEEQILVDQKILDEKALLRANPKIRARWVKDAYLYRPPYFPTEDYQGCRTKKKPIVRAFGAGTGNS